MTAALRSPIHRHPLQSSPLRHLAVVAAVALALMLHAGDARAALAPCKIVEADARVGIVATLMLAEHLAGRAGSPGASKGTRAKAKQTLTSTLELTRGLTSKVLSTQSAKIDKKAVTALGTLNGDLSAIIGETGSTAIIGETGAKALSRCRHSQEQGVARKADPGRGGLSPRVGKGQRVGGVAGRHPARAAVGGEGPGRPLSAHRSSCRAPELMRRS
jgi:hypothetical protein